jgi:hypothetical protein
MQCSLLLAVLVHSLWVVRFGRLLRPSAPMSYIGGAVQAQQDAVQFPPVDDVS